MLDFKQRKGLDCELLPMLKWQCHRPWQSGRRFFCRTTACRYLSSFVRLRIQQTITRSLSIWRVREPEFSPQVPTASPFALALHLSQYPHLAISSSKTRIASIVCCGMSECEWSVSRKHHWFASCANCNSGWIVVQKETQDWPYRWRGCA